MKIIAILLIIISLTKLYIVNSKDVYIDKDLLKGIPIDELTVKQIVIAIIVADGLIGLLSGLFIICL